MFQHIFQGLERSVPLSVDVSGPAIQHGSVWASLANTALNDEAC